MANKIEKAVFMARKFWKDIHRDREIYRLSDDLHSEKLAEYYFLMTEQQMRAGHSQLYHFDEQGIPIIPSYIDVQEKRMLYYPISIGQYGLAIWDTYLKTHAGSDLQRFIKIANWFKDSAIIDKKTGACWLTDVDKPAYRINRPWKSAFSQARAINICLRAFQITGDTDYQQLAEKALLPFLYKVNDGGITTILPEGSFYEEYPSYMPVLVLNGKIFALCGIYDFVRTHRNHDLANKLFNDGVITLLQVLEKYDLGFWSKYSLCQADFHPTVDPATIGYHYLHIVQLRLMYKLTQQPLFNEIATRWDNYVNLYNILKMYKLKYSALRKMNRL